MNTYIFILCLHSDYSIQNGYTLLPKHKESHFSPKGKKNITVYYYYCMIWSDEIYTFLSDGIHFLSHRIQIKLFKALKIADMVNKAFF